MQCLFDCCNLARFEVKLRSGLGDQQARVSALDVGRQVVQQPAKRRHLTARPEGIGPGFEQIRGARELLGLERVVDRLLTQPGAFEPTTRSTMEVPDLVWTLVPQAGSKQIGEQVNWREDASRVAGFATMLLLTLPTTPTSDAPGRR